MDAAGRVETKGDFSCVSAEQTASRAGVSCPCCGVGLTVVQVAAQRTELAAQAADESAVALPVGTMFIDPHTHMIARTTDDYSAMAACRRGGASILARPTAHEYRQLLRLSLAHHRLRAVPGRAIRHPPLLHGGAEFKGSQQRGLGRRRHGYPARFRAEGRRHRHRRDRLRHQTAMEDKYFRQQIELAKELDLPIMIHTPHRDKKRGTTRTMDVLIEHRFDPTAA